RAAICCRQYCPKTLPAVVNCLTRLHPTAYDVGRSPTPSQPLSSHPTEVSSMARSTQKTSTERPNLTAAAPASASKRNRNGLSWKRYFTHQGMAPFDEVQWETREAVITNEKGEA